MAALGNGDRVVLRAAESTDVPQIERLISEGQALSAGEPRNLSGMFVADLDGTLAGVAGIELFGGDALLRGAFVLSDSRSEDIGRVLVEGMLTEAAMLAADSVYLLTTASETFFARFGFMRMPREELPSAVARRAELTDRAPAAATAMRLKLLER
jgi:amino-acid N-acetyltransferase